jgi:hypothetical protein
MPILVAIFVALLVAGGVLLAVSVMSARRDGRSPLNAGLSGSDHTDDPVEAAVAAEPVDVSLAEFLSATAEDGDPYFHVDDLTASLQDARAKATDALAGRRR